MSQEATKTSQALILARLGYLQVAILDIDIHAAQLIRRALSNIGITQTSLSRNSNDMLVILHERPIDILIVEWDSRPDNGIDLTRYLRSRESPHRMLPIILMTSRTDPADHREATDAGVHEIMTRPFTMRSLLACLTRIIDNPRGFILAPTYTGPDRRRGKPPPGVTERRDRAPEPVGKAALGEVFIDDVPRVIPPDYSLKQKLESSAVRMAGIDSILPQAEVAKLSEDYVQWMLTDLQNIRQSFRMIALSPDNTRSSLERIGSGAISIRARAVRSGFTFAARVAGALHNFCYKHFAPGNPDHMVVVEKHIDALHALLHAKILGDEDPTGRELMDELTRLVRKYTEG